MTRQTHDRASAGMGSITKLPSGRFRGRITIGMDPDTGKEIRRSFTADTRREVQQQLIRIRRNADQAIALPTADANRKTVTDALEAFALTIQNRVDAGKLSPNTASFYEDMARHAQPLAERPLATLTAQDIQKWVSQVPGSPRTRRGAFQVLRKALDQAMRTGWMTRNPAALVEAPAPTPQRTIEHATEADVAALVEASPEPYSSAILLMAHTGMRVGEALALRWSDIDLDNRQIYVRAGKTARARRTIPLTDAAVSRLRGLPRNSEWVFPNRVGNQLDRRRFSRIFADASPRKGLTPHSLRHGAATRLLSAGVPVHIVSALLGHADPSITLNIYAHSASDMERAAVGVLGRLTDTPSDTDPQ